VQASDEGRIGHPQKHLGNSHCTKRVPARSTTLRRGDFTASMPESVACWTPGAALAQLAITTQDNMGTDADIPEQALDARIYRVTGTCKRGTCEVYQVEA